MARYNEEQILNSELAVVVLKNCLGEGSYASQISDRTGANRANISEIISHLESLGLLEKGKRTKAQFYRVDHEGLFEYWFKKLGNFEGEPSTEILESSKTGNIGFSGQTLLDRAFKIADKIAEISESDPLEERLEEHREEIKTFAVDYFLRKLDSTLTSSNLSKLLFENFFLSIVFLGLDSDGQIFNDYPYLLTLAEALSIKSDVDIDVMNLELALKDSEGYEPDTGQSNL